MKVLIADDIIFNRLMILEMITSLGHSCLCFSDGKQLIDYYKENVADIIILDIEMPVMNGYETALFIRNEMKSEVPMISFTSHAIDDLYERMIKTGFNDIILKPLTLEKLKNILDKYNSIADEYRKVN